MPTKRTGRGGARKGAGRPRKSKGTTKASQFSTRITQRTRDLLEAEARRKGDSLAVVAQHLLEEGLKERANKRRRKNRPLTALFYLLEQLAEKFVPVGYASDPKYNWRTSPFMFRAFREAVVYLLDYELQPAGAIVAPTPPPLPPWSSEQRAQFDSDLDFEAAREHAEFLHKIRFPVCETPEKRGLQAARTLIGYLKHANAMDRMVDEGNSSIHDLLQTKHFGRETAVNRVKAHYAQADAAKDLGVRYPGNTNTICGVAGSVDVIEEALQQSDLGRKSK
jgi:hypothetical protein